MATKMAVMDGTEAIAHVAHKVNEVIAIYPITPSSPMAEHADAWSAAGKKNLWGIRARGGGDAVRGRGGRGRARGAAGRLAQHHLHRQPGPAAHDPHHVQDRGRADAHVLARHRPLAGCQALSIFGDHQDVMAVRQTGFALLASNSVQEAHDLALIGTAATLKARVPFIHFFDGFRTSHEVQKVELMGDDVLRAMIDEELVLALRQRAMSPDRPDDPRHQPEPRRVLPGPRDRQPVLPGLPRHRAGRTWTGWPGSPAGATTCSTTSALPTPSG